MTRLSGWWSKEQLKRDKIFIASLLLGSVLVAYVVITLGNMFFQQAKEFYELVAVAKDPVVLKAIGISLSMALVSTLVAFVFGVPLAYFLARKNFMGKSMIEGIVDVPLMIPHIVYDPRRDLDLLMQERDEDATKAIVVEARDLMGMPSVDRSRLISWAINLWRFRWQHDHFALASKPDYGLGLG